jgi:hypothetical protein
MAPGVLAHKGGAGIEKQEGLGTYYTPNSTHFIRHYTRELRGIEASF